MKSKKHVSKSETLAALALFVLCGLELIFNEVPFDWPPPGWVRSINGTLLAGMVLLPPVGLWFGWIKSFPRWSYPYPFFVLFFSWMMANTATPGFIFDRELWGWRAWIPLAVVVLISLLMTRSLRPLQAFFTNIRADWTLLTFGLFGGVPLLIAVSFDEVDRLYSLYFMVILTILMLGTVFLYLQRQNHKERIAVLGIGIFLIITLTMAVPTIYWFNHGGTNILPAVIAGILVYLFMFSPALINLIHRPRRRSS